MEVRAISLANVFTGEQVMLITFDDFRIRAENFDPTKTANILRIMCGAFMFPHVAGKFVAGGLSAGTVGFFAKAGFHPAEAWFYIAATAGPFVVWHSSLASARATRARCRCGACDRRLLFADGQGLW